MHDSRDVLHPIYRFLTRLIMGVSDSPTYVLRWGIIATGNISGHFVRDLVLDPSSRDVTDLAHAVIAVGSRSVEKARAFIEKNCPQGGFAQARGLIDQKPEGYGSYAEVYGNPVRFMMVAHCVT